MTARVVDGNRRLPRARAAWLRTAAMAALLWCLAGRAFLGEMPFRLSRLKLPAAGASAAQQAAEEAVYLERTDLARVTFPLLILAAWVLWLTAAALEGRGAFRGRWLCGGMMLFAAVSLVSALAAADKRTALTVWLEQAALLWGGLLAMQVFADRRRWAVLMIAAGAVGVTLAAKGIWQEEVERPDRIAHFEEYKDQQFRQEGLDPAGPRAKLLETRIRSQGALGYFALANPFGSLLIVLLAAAGAVSAGKLAEARRRAKEEKPHLKRGEIHVPTLAAWITAAACSLVLVALLLTRSRGAIGATVLVALAGAGLWRWRATAAGHWRKVTAAAIALTLLGGLAVAGYGLKRDRLPSKTMTVRWYYWVGSARILAESPWLGVGPGNFPDAYLKHRKPEAAEEAVKNPHNVVMHALTQYGLVGGVCFVAVLGALLVSACRPGAKGAEPAEPRGQQGAPPAGAKPKSKGQARAALPAPDPQARHARWALYSLAPIVLLVRGVFSPVGSDAALFVLDGVIPAAILAGAIVLLSWSGRGLSEDVDWAAPPRWVLAAGCVAFAVHNLVTFSLWMPGTATAFWLLAGACAGRGGAGKARDLRRLAWPSAAAAMAAAVAAGVLFWRPVLATTLHGDDMVRAAHAGDLPAATRAAIRAAEADPLDAIPSADAAKLLVASCPSGPAATMQRQLSEACRHAGDAISRSGASSGYHQLKANIVWILVAPGDYFLASTLMDLSDEQQVEKLRAALALRPSAALRARLGDALWRLGRRGEAAKEWQESSLHSYGAISASALTGMARAVAGDPQNIRLRLPYARMLLSIRWPGHTREKSRQEATAQLDAAEFVDKSLADDSVERLTKAEREEIRMLRARIRALAASVESNSDADGSNP